MEISIAIMENNIEVEYVSVTGPSHLISAYIQRNKITTSRDMAYPWAKILETVPPLKFSLPTYF